MTTFDKIPDLLRMNNCTFWTIKTKKDVNSYVFKYDKERSFDDNISRMQQVMNLYKGSYFILEGKENGEANRGSFFFEFSNESPATVLSIPDTGIAGLSETDINNRIENATNAVKLEFERKDLERREKDLENREKEYRQEKESTIGIIVDRIGKVLPRLFPQVAVAGIKNENIEIQSSTDIDNDNNSIDITELEQLLERFSAVEPEWLNLLKSVVEMAERQDSTYKMARNILLNK